MYRAVRSVAFISRCLFRISAETQEILRVFAVYLSPFTQIPVYYLQVGRSRILPHRLYLTIHQINLPFTAIQGVEKKTYRLCRSIILGAVRSQPTSTYVQVCDISIFIFAPCISKIHSVSHTNKSTNSISCTD